MKSEYKGIKRIIKAFSYSFDGFRAVFKSEAAFRQDLLFCLICAIGLCFVTINPVMLAIICFLLFFILFAELVNTTIEVIIDRIGEEYHPLSKKAKDIGSLLVLLSFVCFFAVLIIALLNGLIKL